MRKTFLTVLVFWALLLTSAPAHSAYDLNIGGLVGADYVKADGNKAAGGVSVRGYAAFLLGWQGLKVGPTVFAEFFGELENEYLLGGSVRLGRTTFLDIGGGYNIGGDDNGIGVFGVAGTYLHQKWFAGFSIIYRDGGNRTTSYGPIFGLSF